MTVGETASRLHLQQGKRFVTAVVVAVFDKTFATSYSCTGISRLDDPAGWTLTSAAAMSEGRQRIQRP
jgi:hypothetical protein